MTIVNKYNGRSIKNKCSVFSLSSSALALCNGLGLGTVILALAGLCCLCHWVFWPS